MRIYHTETQQDYDALMVELEEQGCKWLSGRKPTEAKYDWFNYGEKTCVRRISSAGILTKFDFGYSKENYPSVPIIKYKAKVDTSVKLTKENVLNLTDKWIQSKIDSFQDLQNEIKKLDDAPEKVVVPKFVAEWIEWNKETGADLQIMFKAYRHYYDNIKSYSEGMYGKEAVQWYIDNPYKFIQAYEDGYTIEPEQLYYIPLPDLKTSDGLQQVLSKRDTYFASRPNEKLKQRFTKEELKHVPVSYKPYAKPIEEKEG